MKNILKIFILLLIVCPVINATAQKSISVVPLPHQVDLDSGRLKLNNTITIGYESNELSPLASLMENDFYILYGMSVSAQRDGKDILLGLDEKMDEEEYCIDINKLGIRIKGGSYNATCMGATTLLQMVEKKGTGLYVPTGKIQDKPAIGYRGVMVDVARQWHSIHTVKQAVELCRWYKIRYMQLHLADDQSFTFPSTAFPGLPTKNRHYTLNELKDLVEFAKQRGVIIIPEFDAPGHTTEMRKNMPELFGESKLGVIDMTSEKVYEAMETIMKEMMDVFYTSPFFHIGADEAWLGSFEKTDKVKEYVREKGFDNAHDIYLDFIVRMHNIVKKYNRKTLIWESFSGTGSRKVKIPKDIIVFAWETAYQRPDSLIKHGYNIINASWKPAYVTPGRRWSQSYIYNWNIQRWENHWNVTPAYHQPIQLENSEAILGGQFCSWELSELQQIASIHQRVPAISEVFWNGNKKEDYTNFYQRYQLVDERFQRLIFPVQIEKHGFTQPDYEGIYLNRENQFADNATLTFSALFPDTKITYTTDGTVPEFNSEECPKSITINSDMEARFAVFKNTGQRIGYKIANYELNAIHPVFKGNMLPLRDTNIVRNRIEFIDSVTFSFEQLNKDVEIRYSLDNSVPKSELFNQPITVNESATLNARAFRNGKPYGLPYQCKLFKKNYIRSLATGQKTICSASNYGYGPEKSVDGFVDINEFWDAYPYPQWWMTEFRQKQEINELVLYTYWDEHRYYQYTIEVSVDGKNWKKIVDASNNCKVATAGGYRHIVDPVVAKYIKIDMLKNSANKGVHIVELVVK